MPSPAAERVFKRMKCRLTGQTRSANGVPGTVTAYREIGNCRPERCSLRTNPRLAGRSRNSAARVLAAALLLGPGDGYFGCSSGRWPSRAVTGPPCTRTRTSRRSFRIPSHPPSPFAATRASSHRSSKGGRRRRKCWSRLRRPCRQAVAPAVDFVRGSRYTPSCPGVPELYHCVSGGR